MSTAPQVLLVDDHELVRVGVKSAVTEVRGVALRWLEADTLEEAIRIFAAVPGIDLVLLDLNEFVVRQARVLGAVGYVSKGSNVHQLQEALISILQSPHGIEGRLPPIGTASFPRLPVTAAYDRVAELGPRHLEILELVLSGCTNQEISTATKLSLGTVKNYVSSLLLALDVRSRSHLISLFR